jgi:hemerythrin superfamily protein
MNALVLLKQDHNNVDALFSEFEQLGDKAYKAKRRVVDHIIEQLSVHAAIEEMVLYPAIRTKLDDSQPEVLEALEEHHIVKWTLSELEGMDPAAERFDAKVTVLIESVRHHVEEEESDLFDLMRQAFTNQELEELGQQMEDAKATAPTRPHPRVPDVPPLNVLLGLPVAVLDRVLTTGRDAVGRALRRSA